MLVTELDHRVKNLLSRVTAVVSATRRQSASVDEYATALNGRIASLLDAHVLMGQSAGVSLSVLARRQFAPYAALGNTTLAGPDVTLLPDAAEALAMTLHKLVTNAAKYGALSATGGQVTIQWRRDLDGTLCVNWREIGGPAIDGQPKPDYGMCLIRDLIPHELAGRVELQFSPSAVDCTMNIPAKFVDWAR